jgi:serine/threonine protein kinase
MGLAIDKFCCIDSTDLLQKEQQNSSLTERSIPPENTFYNNFILSNSLRRKSLPSNEINFQPIRKNIPLKSLSNLPIGTSNIIRKQIGDPNINYSILKALGHGSFGHVFKVVHKVTGNIRSIKVIPKNNLKPGFTKDEIIQEINILKSLDHPHIIKMFEFYVDENNYYLVNEFCSEGDLGEKLVKIKFFTENVTKLLMFQIFNAVWYLHSNKVIHGDLKVENIMVDSLLEDEKIINHSKHERKKSFATVIKDDSKEIDLWLNKEKTFFNEIPNNTFNLIRKSLTNNNKIEKKNYLNLRMDKVEIKNFELKLIDFGCSKMFTTYKKNFEDTIGTLVYCSPEVLLNNYNEKCDLWSCGIILYLLLTGKFPFYGKTENEIIEKILNQKIEFNEEIFDKISPEAKDLIQKCLIHDKNKRISASEALKHPFFANIDLNNIYHEKIDLKEVLSSLKYFSKHSKFYQVVLAFLSHNYAEKTQLDKLKKIFYKIDTNLDGKLSKEELMNAYKIAGIKINKNQLDKIINSMDYDNNGYIEYEEFIRATIPKENLFTDVNLKTAFELFDLDKNGSISLNEIKEVLGIKKNDDDKVIEELMNEVQRTGNQEITFSQFKESMLNYAKQDIFNLSIKADDDGNNNDNSIIDGDSKN